MFSSMVKLAENLQAAFPISLQSSTMVSRVAATLHIMYYQVRISTANCRQGTDIKQVYNHSNPSNHVCPGEAENGAAAQSATGNHDGFRAGSQPAQDMCWSGDDKHQDPFHSAQAGSCW